MSCCEPKITSDPAVLAWAKPLEVNRSPVFVRTSESNYKVVNPPTVSLHLPAALVLNR